MSHKLPSFSKPRKLPRSTTPSNDELLLSLSTAPPTPLTLPAAPTITTTTDSPTPMRLSKKSSKPRVKRSTSTTRSRSRPPSSMRNASPFQTPPPPTTTTTTTTTTSPTSPAPNELAGGERGVAPQHKQHNSICALEKSPRRSSKKFSNSPKRPLIKMKKTKDRIQLKRSVSFGSSDFELLMRSASTLASSTLDDDPNRVKFEKKVRPNVISYLNSGGGSAPHFSENMPHSSPLLPELKRKITPKRTEFSPTGKSGNFSPPSLASTTPKSITPPPITTTMTMTTTPPLPTITTVRKIHPSKTLSRALRINVQTILISSSSDFEPLVLELMESCMVSQMMKAISAHFLDLNPDSDFRNYGLYCPYLGKWLKSTHFLGEYRFPLDGAKLLFQPPVSKLKEATMLKLVTILRNHLSGNSKGRDAVHLLVSDPAVTAKSLQFLAKKKAIDLDLADDEGKTALMYATINHSFVSAGYIIQHSKGDIDACNNDGRTATHHLFLRENEEDFPYNEREVLNLLIKLVDRGAGIFSRDSEGNTTLHLAALRGQSSSVKYFIEELGMHPNLRNYSGETVLQCAIMSHFIEAVITVVDLGGDLYSQDLFGESPEVRMKHFNIPTQMFYPELSEQEKKIHEIIDNNDEDSLKKSLSSLNDKNLLFDLLVYAARTQKFKTARTIIETTAVDPCLSTNNGQNLLHILSEQINGDKKELIQLFYFLVDCGVNVNGKSNLGESVLHFAVLAENFKCVEGLLALGAYTNVVNQRGETELHYAVTVSDKRIATVLLQAGSDPNIRNVRGVTPSQLALKCEILDALRILDNHRNTVNLTAGRVEPGHELLTYNLMCVSSIHAKFHESSIEGGEGDESMQNILRIEVRHRMADRHCPASSSTSFTLSPNWQAEFRFIFKKGGTFFRNLEFEVVYQSSLVGEKVTTKIGVAHFTAEGSPQPKVYQIPLTRTTGKTGTLFFTLSFQSVSSEKRDTVLSQYKQYDVMDGVRTIKKESGEKRLGKAMAFLGYRPHFPIIIIPGLASSALEAWHTEQGFWRRSRVWIDPLKIGQTAGMQKAFKVFKKKNKEKETKEKEIMREDEEEETTNDPTYTRRKWLKVMMPAPDGFSDPPGIKIRPVEGLHGIDFLVESTIAKKSSYVFGHVISALIEVGYENENLKAASYDWRLPPSKLETRDHYFTRLRDSVKTTHKINGQKVVLMGHSMGCRCIQYFLLWCETFHPGFVSKHVQAFLALGPPFLGAPKAVRAVVTGDCMGLDMFLTPDEARLFSRSCGSSPWLFPVDEQQFPDVVCRVSDRNVGKNFQNTDTKTLLRSFATRTNEFLEKHYDTDPLYLKTEKESNVAKQLPVLAPPPVNLWVIIGVNLPTEVSYYFKVDKKGAKGHDPVLVLEPSADKFSNKKNGVSNPRGLQISGGIAYETKSTYQPTIRGNKSGDGTVPFCSLNYAHFWKRQAEEQGTGLDVQIVEVEGAEHREMLMNDVVLKAIIEFTCVKT